MLGNRRNVLVVDDDNLIVEFVTTVLSQFSDKLVISVANSTEDALFAFERAKYRLVITDLFMEGMGGIEGIRLYRKHCKEIPILAISAGYKGMSPQYALNAAKNIGATALLPKPFSPEELADKVALLINLDENPEFNSTVKV